MPKCSFYVNLPGLGWGPGGTLLRQGWFAVGIANWEAQRWVRVSVPPQAKESLGSREGIGGF